VIVRRSILDLIGYVEYDVWSEPCLYLWIDDLKETCRDVSMIDLLSSPDIQGDLVVEDFHWGSIF